MGLYWDSGKENGMEREREREEHSTYLRPDPARTLIPIDSIGMGVVFLKPKA